MTSTISTVEMIQKLVENPDTVAMDSKGNLVVYLDGGIVYSTSKRGLTLGVRGMSKRWILLGRK